MYCLSANCFLEMFLQNFTLEHRVNAHAMIKYILILLSFIPCHAFAEPVNEPSVESNIQDMDTDHDGQVSMTEIKLHLQKKFGKEYKSELLDKLEARANAKSCGSSFTRPLP